VNSLPNPASHGKPKLGETGGDRDLLGQVLRSATAEARSVASKLESIAAAVRARTITVADAIQWAEDERLLHLLRFGPHSKCERAQ
jgi:hypothetical protein